MKALLAQPFFLLSAAILVGAIVWRIVDMIRGYPRRPHDE